MTILSLLALGLPTVVSLALVVVMRRQGSTLAAVQGNLQRLAIEATPLTVSPPGGSVGVVSHDGQEGALSFPAPEEGALSFPAPVAEVVALLPALTHALSPVPSPAQAQALKGVVWKKQNGRPEECRVAVAPRWSNENYHPQRMVEAQALIAHLTAAEVTLYQGRFRLVELYVESGQLGYAVHTLFELHQGAMDRRWSDSHVAQAALA